MENVVWKMAAICLGLNVLTPCGYVTPYDSIELGHHWYNMSRCCLGAKPLSAPMKTSSQLDHEKDLQWETESKVL